MSKVSISQMSMRTDSFNFNNKKEEAKEKIKFDNSFDQALHH